MASSPRAREPPRRALTLATSASPPSGDGRDISRCLAMHSAAVACTYEAFQDGMLRARDHRPGTSAPTTPRIHARMRARPGLASMRLTAACQCP